MQQQLSLDELVALYEAEAVLVGQDGSPARGTNAIRDALAQFIAMKPKIRMNVVKTVRPGGSVAVLYNDWSLAATGPDGTPIQLAGKAIEVVRRQPDGNWLFVVDDPFARG